MDFAKKQLEKYGWTEGKLTYLFATLGLGREENGIASPVKVKVKRDVGGVGLTPGAEFGNWWSDVFNRAAQNIDVMADEDGVCIERISEDDTSLLVKAKHYGNHRKSLLYGGFLESTCTYDRWTTTAVGLKSYIGTPMDEHKKSGNVSEVEVESNLDAQRCLTDEELLKACGGRTAHKAARHGLKLNGKLKRIEEQELQQASTTGHSEDTLSRTGDSVRDKNQIRKRKRTKDTRNRKKQKLCRGGVT